jgi:hypothetical protein
MTNGEEEKRLPVNPSTTIAARILMSGRIEAII